MAFAALLGIGVLAAVMMLLKWYAVTDVGNLKRLLAWVGIGALALVVIFLAVTGRMGAALAALAGLLVWASRILNLIHMGRQFGGIFGKKRQGAEGAAPSAAAMTEEEAYRVLGLKPRATKEEIKAAHRRLIEQIHPDHGGSDYLAAKVNLAKDFLLKTQRPS
jgi:DnaJ family protein C protein 19